MSPMSRGNMEPSKESIKQPTVKNIKNKRKRGGTVTTKNHRFEPFSERIARINVDPVRRTGHETLDSDADSFFKNKLDYWMDINTSENFSAFIKTAEPLSENLPQILHNQSRIVELLLIHIRKEDFYSLEPLLDLVAQFAHDLGPRFEAYFQEIVECILKIAAVNHHVDVIEWSFNCLAWLFKFLSRLLVPDLVPLYNLMSPLLGKKKQKAFMGRFAAESMSFLVRKASLSYSKNPDSLDRLVQHAFKDLESTQKEQQVQYLGGIATLFAEGIKGVQTSISTGGPAVVQALMKHLLGPTEDENTSASLELSCIQSTLVSTIHQTEGKEFIPIMNILLDVTSRESLQTNYVRLQRSCDIFFTVMGTRKATRILEWDPVLRRLLDFLDTMPSTDQDISTSVMTSVLNTVGLAFVYAPLDIIFDPSYFKPFVAKLENPESTSKFLRMCVFVQKVDKQRFNNSQLCIRLDCASTRNWGYCETEYCEFIPPLLLFPCKRRLDESSYCLSDQWVKQISARLQSVLESMGNNTLANPLNIALVNRYLQTLPYLSMHHSTRDELIAILGELVKTVLQNSQISSHLARRFSLTRGLQAFAHRTYPEYFDRSLLQSVFAASQDFAPSILYLEGLELLIDRQKLGAIDGFENYVILMESLTKNLTTALHEIRSQSLKILRSIYHRNSGKVPRVLDLLQEVESSGFSIHNQRAISMTIRRISAFDVTGSDLWIQRIVPAYCCGLLLVRLAPIWNDVCNVLESLCQVNGVEDFLMAITLQWLHVEKAPKAESTSRDSIQNQMKPTSPELQCYNLSFLEKAATEASEEVECASERLQARLKSDVAVAAPTSRFNRMQALRAFNKLPNVVEKKSRAFVPVFCDWLTPDRKDPSIETDSKGDTETIPSLPGLTLPKTASIARDEKTMMLRVVAKFNNPTVLYKADEVRSTLLATLSSGDPEFQQLALKALFAWKNPSIKPYEENLMSLVDGSRFRDSMMEFLSLENGVHPVRPEHRLELRPILLRILYGRILSRGSSKRQETPSARKKAVWDVLSRLGTDDLEAFLDIGLEPLDSLRLAAKASSGIVESAQFDQSNLVSLRQQLGMLKTVEDLLQTLGHHISPFSYKVLDVVLYCLVSSSRKLNKGNKETQEANEDNSNVGYLKSIRSQGMKCLASIFASCPEQDWMPYGLVINEELIGPRLEKFPVETAESISSLLRLFSTWSSTPKMLPLLFVGGPKVIEAVAKCLGLARDEVKQFVISDIIINVLTLAQADKVLENGDLVAEVEVEDEHHPSSAISGIRNYLSDGLAVNIMNEIATLLESLPIKEITKESIKALMILSHFLSQPKDFEKLIEIMLMLLQQPSKQVNLGLQSEVLNVLEQLLDRRGHGLESERLERIVETISPYFNILPDVRNRQKLCRILQQVSAYNEDFECPAELCSNVNSMSPSRLDVPNFDLRISALNLIEEKGKELKKEVQWSPILHNLLYFVKDEDELSIRAAASSSLRQFIRYSKSLGTNKLVKSTLIPAIERGVRLPSPEVRAEYITLLAEMVTQDIGNTEDMKALRGPDEESSVLHNIFHLQEHRRTRALTRLADRCGEVSSPHINRILIPMVMTIITDAEEKSQQNLIVQALHALKALTRRLGWQALRSFLQRLTSEKSKFESKLGLKVLAAIVEGYASSCQNQSNSEEEPARMSDSEDNFAGDKVTQNPCPRLPGPEGRSKTLSSTVLDPLLEYIHYKDEAEMEFRVSIAISAVKILFTFTSDDISHRLPIILIDVCNILKSKAQDARDAARKTLAEIGSLIGSEYFGFIVKQLQTTLRRGSQLHVASYTLHSLLVSLVPQCRYGELDSSLPSIMGIITEDVFGRTGQEKDATEYVSKMREVKAKSHSYDSLELVTSVTSILSVKELFRPIRAQTNNPRAKQDKIDELLRRLREGLRRNQGANSQQFLTLCYEILKDADFQERQDEASMPPSHYKLAAFSLETLRRVLDKHENLKTVENLSGFMPKVANCLRQNDETLQITTLRLLGAVIKVPLKQLDVNAGQYIQRIRDIIEAESSTASPLAQAALRLGAALLRERRQAVYKQSHFENHVAFIIKRIGPDLEEPSRPGERDRQVAAFRFLRAVCDRGVLIPEVYEIMDTIRKVMIRSQEPPIPELARSVFQRFLIDYFDGKEDLKSPSQKGLRRQLEFLAKQIQTFPHPHGRLSIMEALGFIFEKRSGNAKDHFLDEFYAPLIAVLLTDPDDRCRRYATTLMKYIFQNASTGLSQGLRSRKWMALESDSDIELRAGIKCWNIFIEARKEAGDAQSYIAELSPVSEASQRLITSITRENMQDMEEEGNEELLTDLLTLHGCLLVQLPSLVLNENSEECWEAILKMVTAKSNTVRLVAAKVIGSLLMQLEAFDTASSTVTNKVYGASGQSLAPQIIEAFTSVLESDEGSDPEVIQHASTNLALFAKHNSIKTSERLFTTLLTRVSAAARIDRSSHSMLANLESTKLLVQLCKEGTLQTLTQPERLNPLLVFIANIIDPAVPQRNPTSTQGPSSGTATLSEDSAAVQSLNSEVHNLASVLQNRMGTAEYATQFQKVRQEVLARRDERKRKRQVDAVSRPERTERIKRRKRETGREKRKEKNKIAAGRRRGY